MIGEGVGNKIGEGVGNKLGLGVRVIGVGNKLGFRVIGEGVGYLIYLQCYQSLPGIETTRHPLIHYSWCHNSENNGRQSKDC